MGSTTCYYGPTFNTLRHRALVSMLFAWLELGRSRHLLQGFDEVADDGTVREIKGIDIIETGDGKILSIDVYRKCTASA